MHGLGLRLGLFHNIVHITIAAKFTDMKCGGFGRACLVAIYRGSGGMSLENV